jgi:Uma2 family endonuclease
MQSSAVGTLESAMPVSEKTFRQLALEDPEGHWELYCGSLRQKPNMTYEHNHTARRLFRSLDRQLEDSEFEVTMNMGHVSRSPEHYYIPDVFVIPLELTQPLRGRHVLEAYDAPLPLVVEIWSSSTGKYDIDEKLPEYERRGDLEIWRIHPYEHTLIARRRQPDGSYTETQYTGGTVELHAIPGVFIDLDALFS